MPAAGGSRPNRLAPVSGPQERVHKPSSVEQVIDVPHLAGFMVQSRPQVWKRLRHVGLSGISIPNLTRRRGDQDVVGGSPAQVRTGVG